MRVGVSIYALLARLMPRRYREAYLAESVVDLAAMLAESARLRDESVPGTALRAYADLVWRIPVEWWAVLRPAPLWVETALMRGASERGRRW